MFDVAPTRRLAALCVLAFAALVALSAAADDPPRADDASRADELPLKDPMQPYARPQAGGAVAEAPRGYELTAVLVSDSRRVAVINGSLRRVGDEFDGARLVRIDADSVRVRRAGEELVVLLNRRRTGAETTEGASAR